ncbi:MAG: hypothetical protein QOH95_292 [Gaiellaceae bacterium]|nr:hypothetical protein [Gaiellaceae bacterium]
MGAGTLVVTLVPSHGGSGHAVVPRAPAFGAGPTTAGAGFGSTAAEERAARRAEGQVRPLARAFVDDLALRRDLPRAYALLGPGLRKRYSLADWRHGRGLPLAATGAEGGVSVAFSGPTTVGFVADLDSDVLFAVRFDRLGGRWAVAYVRQGHSSARLSSSNFAPAGFLPGSRRETAWTWLALAGGFLGVLAVAVLVERRLSS